MTINIRIKAEKVTICQDNEHQGFLKVLNVLADHLEAIARCEPFKTEENFTMALSVAEQAIVDRFNKATTDISNKIDALIANSGNLDDAEFNAQLQAIADGLDALGKPNTPVPGPGPQPTP